MGQRQGAWSEEQTDGARRALAFDEAFGAGARSDYNGNECEWERIWAGARIAEAWRGRARRQGTQRCLQIEVQRELTG